MELAPRLHCGKARRSLRLARSGNVRIPVKKVPGQPDSEHDIRDELRTLTEETRKLREELRGMIDTPKPLDPTRALRPPQSWPKERAKAAPGRRTGPQRHKKR